MRQSLYVIQAEDGPVKVGIATNPWQRLKALQAESEFPLSIAFIGECGHGQAKKVEAAAHEILGQHYQRPHHRSEWFDAPSAIAIDAVHVAAAYVGTSVTAKDTAQHFPSLFHLILPLGLWFQIDEWRRLQPDLPSRAEAIRRLVEQALRGRK